MARLILLGTAAAVPDASQENTYLALEGPHGSLMIDCAGGPIGRLAQARVPHASLDAVLITHIHPDHAYGFPLLLMGLWLLGRTRPLKVFGLDVVVARLRSIMDAYGWDEWPRFYPVDFQTVEEWVGAPVLDNADFRITATRNEHMVPTIGLRIENKANGFVVTYSSDTAPCQAIVDLARGSDVLIHEAAGATPGHASAAQAGAIARRAGAKKLVLAHYQVSADPLALKTEAQATFGGPVDVARDMAEYAI